MKFHPDKCHVLTLGKFSDIKHAHRYIMEENELQHVFIEKDLGVLVNFNLSFEDHIAEKVKKANSMLGLIKRSLKFLRTSGFTLMYTAIVCPHVESILDPSGHPDCISLST